MKSHQKFVIFRKNEEKGKSGKCKKGKCDYETRSFNVSNLDVDHEAKCPGEYFFEDGDSLQLVSPNYPGRYPNKYNCIWKLHAVGCQFNVVCDDLYTKPTCQGTDTMGLF